jgi:hypothetical protein
LISKRKTIITLLVGVTLLLIIIALLLKPIPQWQSYHNFADQRIWFGLPNAENVLSNIPLALVGIWGLFLLLSPGKIQFLHSNERWPWLGISIGLILTAFGSGYYHLAPNNATLVWDRLPLTILYMSFVATLINDRITFRFSVLLWLALLCIGFYSVFYWYVSELRGTGDLRLYALVQGYAIVVALIMLFVPSHYTRTGDLAVVVGFYILAKLFEMFDLKIYLFDADLISGHTLKHLAAAMAGLWLMRMVWKRKAVVSTHYSL